MTAPAARWFFAAWVLLWAGALLLVFAQGFFMAREWWMLAAGPALAIAVLWIGKRWSQGLRRRGAIACNGLRLLALLHVLPLAAQVFHLGTPRWDNVVLALIGWGLLEAAGWTSGTPKAPDNAPN